LGYGQDTCGLPVTGLLQECGCPAGRNVMDKNQGEVRIKKGTGPLGVCPYLGVQDDPATHYAWAKPGHFCYRVRPAQAIAVNHQENHCMNGRYPTCVVYPASWKGALPPQIRDDGYADWSTRAAAIKTSIVTIGSPKSDTQPVEKSTSRFGMDLSSLRDQADFIEEEPESPTWWSTRRGKIALAALILLPLIVLSAWAIIMTTWASQGTPPSEPVAGAVDLTATWQAGLAILPSATPSPTGTPTQEPTWTATPTQVPDTPTATIDTRPSDTPAPDGTSTATLSPYTCQEIEAYTVEMVEGPILTPQPGYVITSSSSVPPIRSTWILKNTSSCNWEEILLVSRTSQRLLAPFLRVNGQLVVPSGSQSQYSISPGEQVEVMLGFTLTSAQSIRSEWDLVINGFRLTNQPPLSLDVNNWVINPLPPTIIRDDDGSSSGSSDDSDDEPPSTRP